MTNVILILSMK